MSTPKKRALITGVSGQDGSYLSELLLAKGYDVHGMVRRTSQLSRSRIDQMIDDARKNGNIFNLHYGDLSDSVGLNRLIATIKPHEVYNLASQSHVGISFTDPEYATDINGSAVMRLLEAVRFIDKDIRFYQASSSEMFGNAAQGILTESSPFAPRSPYGASKLYAHWMVNIYRESYGLYACSGILFNHESPLRGENFVSRKITLSLARIRAGKLDRMTLGNLDARRDWGFAGDYVEAMWLMLQQERSDNYVVATGETHTVREFVEKAAAIAGYDMAWEGSGVDEIGRDRKTGSVIVAVNPKYYRPLDVTFSYGDASKARKTFNWTPRLGFNGLVAVMMETDLKSCC
jgi:GDPmannose 4,6-dehydratase